MKLWIDDLRPPPTSEWQWAKTSQEAIDLIAAVGLSQISHISFDHDLGGNDTTMRVVDYIDMLVSIGGQRLHVWGTHSQNPVGSMNIFRAMNRIRERNAK